MQDLTRKRIIRKLEALPDSQLYQVLDFIEFLESKYARERTVAESVFERFAERVEDGMRARAVAVGVMSRTMGALGTAVRLLDGLAAAGRKALALPDSDAALAEAPAPLPGGTGAATQRPGGGGPEGADGA